MTQPADQGLRKGVLGPFQIAFFVISAAGPLVAMAGGIPVAMLFGNGPGIPAMFLFSSLILLAFACGYTAMARTVRNAGAFYAFAARGLGGQAAGATGIIALFSYNAMQISLYGLFGTAAKALIDPVIGATLPWWLYALGAFLLIAFLGYRQVDLSARILGLLVAGEYLVVLVLVVAVMLAGGAEGLSARPFTPSIVMGGSPAIGLMLCFSAFVGFEATTIYSEEARNPERTIPRATYASVLLIGGFYTLSTWAIVNGAGVDHLVAMLSGTSEPTELLFTLSGRYVGPGLSHAMRILFVTSTFASLLAFHNAVARYLFAMSREKLLPSLAGHTHPRYQSPHIASVLQSIFALFCIALFAISGADPVLVLFTLFSAIATLGIILLMAITCFAAIFYLRRQGIGPVTLLLTTIALILLLGIVLLTMVRFDLLVGTTYGFARYLPVSLAIAGAYGTFLARRLKARSPESYARLGQSAQ